MDERAEIERERARLGLPTRAVIGCVHGNLEALEAVLADVDRQSIFDVVCLGDVIGYGPDPVECIELVRARCRFTLRGHADDAFFAGFIPWGSINAVRVIEWTRERLVDRSDLRAFLEALPERHEEGGDLYVHGSPRDPIHEYLLETDLGYQPEQKYEEVFAAVSERVFVAHSHVPGVITPDLAWHEPLEPYTQPPTTKAAINVGSVGQPRDGDARACYVTVAGRTVEWRRVPYDFTRTQEKMRAAGFADHLVNRLPKGV